jgi:hypothetical protein
MRIYTWLALQKEMADESACEVVVMQNVIAVFKFRTIKRYQKD